MVKEKPITWLTALSVVGMLSVGCVGDMRQPSAVGTGAPHVATPGVGRARPTQVNVAEAARLSLTQIIRIKQFSSELCSKIARGERPEVPTPTDPSVWSAECYVPTAMIRDQPTIDQFVGALDEDLLVPDSRVACVANYLVEFHRSDGVTVTFEYDCRGPDKYFVNARATDRSFDLQGSVRVPNRFTDLVEAQVEHSQEVSK